MNGISFASAQPPDWKPHEREAERVADQRRETIKPRSLALAKELYAAKEKSVAQIMEQTGFKSRATFYKYVVGSPTERKL